MCGKLLLWQSYNRKLFLLPSQGGGVALGRLLTKWKQLLTSGELGCDSNSAHFWKQ